MKLNKPHIYKVKDNWYCKVRPDGWRGVLLGVPAETPKRAFERFLKVWKI